MQSVKIVLTCIAAAVLYGIVHDQVTARICVEYFTVGHPPVFAITDPTLLGIGWGIIATWWVGLLLGVPLALAARAGLRPMRSLGSLLCPLGVLLAIMAASALAAGLLGWVLAERGMVQLGGPLAQKLPASRHVSFIADWWAHSASYLVGLVGGIVVIGLVWRSRGRAAAFRSDSRDLSGTDLASRDKLRS